MSLSIHIADRRGEHAVTEEAFPLSIGGATAGIRLPGDDSDRVYAFVGYSDANIFVQPADDLVAVFLNGQRVTGSRWLQHGDAIRIGSAEVICEQRDGEMWLRASAHARAPEIRPPLSPPPTEAPGIGARDTESATPPVKAAPAASRRGGSRMLTGILLGVFSILVLVAGFVFLATPVSINIQPEPRSLDVRGMLPDIEVGDRRLMLPGEYVLVAEREGYRRLEAPLVVSPASHKTVRLAMEKLPGLVSIASRPVSGARVEIDGHDAGVTPIENIELVAGVHELRVDAPRHLPAMVAFEVEGLGKTQALEVELTPDWAPVSLSSDPPGAGIVLDGEPAGETPATLEIASGEHVLELNLDTYKPVQVKVAVAANEAQTLPTFKLDPADALLRLETRPAGASVSVDGQYRGTTPLELTLSPNDSHKISISKAGHSAASRTVQLEPAQEDSLQVDLAALYGTLFVTSEPADAEVFVDGKSRGKAPQRIKLTVAPHRVEVRKAGYESWKKTITPRAGYSQTVNATLRTRTAPRAPATAKGAAKGGEASMKSEPSPGRITTSERQVLRLVKPGRFEMGASRREQGRRPNENQRTVEITRPFYISEKEITNAEFKRFRSAHRSGAFGGLSLDGADQPVVGITWENAAAYANWLSQKESLPPAYERKGGKLVAVFPPTRGYRLPSEAEWAYAARFAGQAAPRKYPWGGSFPPPDRSANFADSSAQRVLPNVLTGYNDGYAVTAPVGSFAPNTLGIHDLGGNVAEWCHDYYGVYPDAAGKVAVNPVGPRDGRHHVVRGSSWRHATISELRLAYRGYSEEARPDLGFRIVRYAD